MLNDRYFFTFCIPGMAFDGHSLAKQSLGGSETAGLCLARELAKLGHKVTVFSNCERPGMYDGVAYHRTQAWQLYAPTTPHDVCVVQRVADVLRQPTAAKLNLVWCHDMAMGRQADDLRATMWNVDRLVVLSDYMRQQYSSTYGIPEEWLWKSRNGIDLFRVPANSLVSRNRKRLVYSARPERGLDNLLDHILPVLFERDPEIEVALFGYDNPVEHMREFYSALSEKSKRYGDKVRFIGQLDKNTLYEEYIRSGVYVYPTPSPAMPSFREISCISVMEAQACGMPIVTSANGALTETLAPDAGVLVDGDPWSPEYVEKFVSAVLTYINDDNAWNTASQAGRQHAQTLGWDKVAEEWTEQVGRLLTKFNDDRVRLAHHFYRRSDIFAAKTALVDQKGASANALQKKIDREYGFVASREALAKHYRRAGERTTTHLKQFDIKSLDFTTTNEHRFETIDRLLASMPDAHRILEFGCGHGWSTIYLHNKVGRRWTGIDIDPGACQWARKFADVHAQDPTALEFLVGDETIDLSDYEKFDCLIISEVLEHCINPVEVVDFLERWIKPDGLVIITTPYGPAEYGTPNWIQFRNHVWEFDPHDLREMFGAKKGLSIKATMLERNKYTDEPVGYHLTTYKVTNAPTNSIDMERKLRLQRPRQTVSAIMMGGPECEDTLRWCLKSVYPYVDEIVMADCGLSKEARAICRGVSARIIKSVPPTQYGFERPRNDGLRAARMDFVLWIDTDEKLLGGEQLLKYCRQSMYHSFSIRQHHFCVDAGFPPDLPTRLFRKGPYKGQRMRFIGAIHEHPEFGLNKGPGPTIIVPDVHIAHVGYLTEDIRRTRFIRNNPLLQVDQEKYPERLLQKHLIMRDLCILNMYELQANGAKITDDIRNRAEEVCRLWREYFKGKPSLTNMDSLQYYTQALQVLGRGVDLSFSLAANRDGKGDQLNGGALVRFESAEDAREHLGFMIEEKLQPLLREEW